MNSHKLLTFVALLAVASAGRVNFTECPGSDKGLGTVKEVYCDQFADWADINFKKGSTYTFGIKFVTGEASHGLAPKVVGIIAGVGVPCNGAGNPNGCNDLVGGSCPAFPGKDYHYKASIIFASALPPTSLIFQWGLVSTDASGTIGQHQACFRVPATIIA